MTAGRDGGFGLRVNNTERHRIEVRTHTVHADTNDSKLMLANVVRAVQMKLSLPPAVHAIRQIHQHTRRRGMHKTYTILELECTAHYLMRF